MEWIVDHTTIKGEAESDQFHVKVAKEGYNTTIDVNATPDEKYSSFRASVAARFGLDAIYSDVLTFGLTFNGRSPASREYSHNEKLPFSSLK